MTVWDALDDGRTVKGIERQIASGEAAQSWLLLGPRGSGKGAVSKAMAAALICSREPNVGCGRCSVCARIARRRHPDVHHIVPEGPLIAVDVIRESVIPEASRSPFEGERKVFILEEAERMNEPAQNALLKTLEEPQLDTAFILLSEAEEEVLETIRSRCRIVRLEAVPEARVVELLEAEGANHDDAVVAARVSEGDLEAARSLAFDASVKARRRAWLGVPGRLESTVDALDAAAEILDDARRAGKEHEREQKVEIQELAEAMGE
ncbi:MAG: DNA polymerase III subunit delta', partial [Actinobacteria bacterium]|nr:DNA polymerase III subunit delta' [Actinomycetota bacterium]